MSGTVKFFNSTKGFGFITNDETGEDIFVHITALNNGVSELQDGQKVTYEIEQDARSGRDRAANVTVI